MKVMDEDVDEVDTRDKNKITNVLSKSEHNELEGNEKCDRDSLENKDIARIRSHIGQVTKNGDFCLKTCDPDSSKSGTKKSNLDPSKQPSASLRQEPKVVGYQKDTWLLSLRLSYSLGLVATP